MGTPTKKEGLMFEGVTVPPAKSKLPRVLFGGVLIAIIVASGLFVHSNIRTYFTVAEKTEKPSEQAGYQEAVQTANKLIDSYTHEVTPAFSEGKNSQNYGLEENSTSTKSISGKIVFTGILKSGSISPYVQAYALDVSGTKNSPRVLYPQYQFNAMAEFEDATKVFLIATSADSLTEDDKTGVHVFDTKLGTLQSFKSTRGTNERNLAWSKKAALLALNRSRTVQSTYVDMLSLESWETVVIDPKSDAVIATIGGAYQPKWSPDGTKLIFLKTDGLYWFDMKTKIESKLISVAKDGAVIATSMIDLSQDGKSLLWTTAKSGVISLYNVTSWNTVSLSEVGRMQLSGTEVYWPLFSPDGSQYAVQTIDSLKENDLERKNPRIEIRPIKGQNPIFKYSLADFNFDQLFSDAWVK